MKKQSNADYQSIRAVSSHWLKTMLDSPAECYRHYIDPSRPPQKSKVSLRFGSLVHCLALTPLRFDSEIIVSDIGRRSAKDKAMHETWERAGMTVVSEREVEKAKAVVGAIKANKEASRLISRGMKERAIIKPRADGLLPLKARLDVHNEANRQGIELKTTWSLGKAKAAIERYRYPLSAAFYMDMVRGNSFVFVFAQTTEPFDVEVIPMERQQLQEGREQYQSALGRFDDCWETGEWPESDPVPDLDDDPLMMEFAPQKSAARQRFDLPVGELEL